MPAFTSHRQIILRLARSLHRDLPAHLGNPLFLLIHQGMPQPSQDT